MAVNIDAGPSSDRHRHDGSDGHGHAHGASHRPQAVRHAHGDANPGAANLLTSPGRGTSYAPALSLLRLSILLRLVGAAILAAIIWAAMHWATL